MLLHAGSVTRGLLLEAAQLTSVSKQDVRCWPRPPDTLYMSPASGTAHLCTHVLRVHMLHPCATVGRPVQA
jgi:hypothetical protein